MLLPNSITSVTICLAISATSAYHERLSVEWVPTVYHWWLGDIKQANANQGNAERPLP
jgi:hypothetical protein